MTDMGGVSAIRFAELAKVMSAAARAQGWVVPDFRSPPRIHGATRTMKHTDSSLMVAIALRNRSFFSVVVDMIDAYIEANHLIATEAAHCRTVLLEAVSTIEQIVAA